MLSSLQRSMTSLLNIIFVCLFGVICSHSWFFPLIWRRPHYRWRTANLDIYSGRMAIEQNVFLNVPHLLWHRPSSYSGHLRAPVTHLLPIVWQCGKVNTCFNEFCNQDSYSQPSTFEQNALTACASIAASLH